MSFTCARRYMATEIVLSKLDNVYLVSVCYHCRIVDSGCSR